MKFPHHVSLRARVLAFTAALAALALSALPSCSSDPESALGSESDLLGSEPGTVYQDTIGVFEDTVYVMGTPIAGEEALEFGRLDGYDRAMVLQPGFAELVAADTTRTVVTARLRLSAAEIDGSYPARFYTLANSYSQGDAIATLDTVAPIVHPVSGSPERNLQALPRSYMLPPELVQDWIRKRTPRVAMAVLYTDAFNDRVATFVAQDADSARPRLEVTFADSVRTNYYIRADATVYTPLTTTSNLVISDGYARRVYLRVRLDELADDAAVHTAKIRLHLVPGTVLGENTTAVIYIPASTDPADPDFKGGQLVTEKDFVEGDELLEFSLTNAIFLILQGTLVDNGFAIRFRDEGTELRAVEFYGTDAAIDSLRPRVYVTTSTPAVFNP